MPVLFLFVGALFLSAAVRGEEQTHKLLALVKGDFTGRNNFLVWCLALGALAGVGYVKPLRPISNILLVLVFIAIILRNAGPDGSGNLLSSFFKQIQSTEGQ